jgi:non-homologous end joining protein Ku
MNGVEEKTYSGSPLLGHIETQRPENEGTRDHPSRPEPPASGRIIDLMEALKESMKVVQRGKKQVGQKNGRKA